MQEEIANLVHPVLTYALRLKARLKAGEKPLLDVEQSALKGLLHTEVEARRWSSFGGDSRPDLAIGGSTGEMGQRAGQFLGTRYSLVCWLDELFTLDSPWAAEWNERKLEVALYGTNDRAWKFWDQARQAEARPEDDALEVFFLCVMLGFTGELREEPSKLRAWVAATQTRLTKVRGREWTPPVELDPITYVPPLHGPERLQRMLLVGGIAFLAIIPILVFFIVQHIAAEQWISIAMGLLGKLWNAIKAVPGLIFPFLGKAADVRGWSPWVRWTLHGVFLVLLLVGLGYLNWLFDLEKVLRTPLGFLRKIWLPLLAFLIYVLVWLGWWLRKLLAPEENTSVFPDIDAAWAEALKALDQAGIDLSAAPLFVVLGQSQGTEESLFAAAQLPLQVRHVPRSPTAPLHLYASRDGIYLTCGGASLLARQTALLTEEAAAEQDREPVRAAPVPEASGRRTLHWKSVGERPEPSAPSSAAPLAAGAPFEMSPVRARRNRLLLADDEAEILTARLEYLCRRVAEERRPYCPANGILVLVPWAASETDGDAQQTARLCQRDLATLRRVLRVQCPVIALVSDLDRALGFRELIGRLPPTQRQQRLGRSFPLVPDLAPEQLPEMIQDGIRWVCETLFPNLIYRLLSLDPGELEPEEPAIKGNARLYQLLCELRARRNRLGDLLRRAVVRPERGATLFGGCYFAATGRDAASEQAFCAGVFPLLVDNQNFVSWTPEALAEEAKLRRWTTYGYAGLIALVAVLVVAAYFLWPT